MAASNRVNFGMVRSFKRSSSAIYITLNPLQQQLDGVEAQRGGVLRFGGQATYGIVHDGRGEAGDLRRRPAFQPFRQRRSGGDGCRTAAPLVANFPRDARFEARRETQDVAAC